MDDDLKLVKYFDEKYFYLDNTVKIPAEKIFLHISEFLHARIGEFKMIYKSFSGMPLEKQIFLLMLNVRYLEVALNKLQKKLKVLLIEFNTFKANQILI